MESLDLTGYLIEDLNGVRVCTAHALSVGGYRLGNEPAANRLFIPSGQPYVHVHDMPNLHELTVGSHTKTLRIKDCPKLISVVFGSNVSTIEILNCASLNHIFLPSGVKHLTLVNMNRLVVNSPTLVNTISTVECPNVSFKFKR